MTRDHVQYLGGGSTPALGSRPRAHGALIPLLNEQTFAPLKTWTRLVHSSRSAEGTRKCVNGRVGVGGARTATPFSPKNGGAPTCGRKAILGCTMLRGSHQ